MSQVAAHKNFAVVISSQHSRISSTIAEVVRSKIETSGNTDDELLLSWVTSHNESVSACRELLSRRQTDAVIVISSFSGSDPLPAHQMAKNLRSRLTEVASGSNKPMTFGVVVEAVEQGFETSINDLIRNAVEKTCEEAIVAVRRVGRI
ncbi:MAG: 6,7-dimethyl-8-ribityllumazine synthase [bacterium]|nr:6,7-dimethyl-8-ribityllumazine synthase [bacterium]